MVVTVQVLFLQGQEYDIYIYKACVSKNSPQKEHHFLSQEQD